MEYVFAALHADTGDLQSADRDLKEALSLAPNNVNSLMNFGTLMWKMGQKDSARQTFNHVLELDKNNRQALSALGYLARDAGDNKLAESFFQRRRFLHQTVSRCGSSVGIYVIGKTSLGR